MKLKSDFLVVPHSKVRLSKFSTDAHPGAEDKDAAEPILETHRKRLADLQEVF